MEIDITWIRHGKIKIDKNIKYCPPDNELELSSEAIKKARNLAKHFYSKYTEIIFSSPHKRALQTARHLAHLNKNIDIQVDESIKEYFPSELLGKSLEEIENKYGNNIYEKMISGECELFPKSEKIDDAESRIIKFFIKNAKNKKIVIVSHGTLHSLFLIKILGGKREFSKNIHLDCLNMSEFTYNTKTLDFKIHKVNVPIKENIFYNEK
jgi:broad specificity phosphatase PhoE